MDFLRVVLGLFCLFFAHYLGRSIVRARIGRRCDWGIHPGGGVVGGGGVG